MISPLGGSLFCGKGSLRDGGVMEVGDGMVLGEKVRGSWMNM